MQRKNSRERKINKKGEEYYQCEECKLIYEDKKWAEKCQKWCKGINPAI